MEDYIHTYCPQLYNYNLFIFFDKIFPSCDFTKDNIYHIYFTYFRNEIKDYNVVSLFTIVKNDSYIVYLLNKSKLIIIENPLDICKHLSCNELKLIGIQKNKFLKQENIFNHEKWKKINIIKSSNNVLDETYILNLQYNYSFKGNENDLLDIINVVLSMKIHLRQIQTIIFDNNLNIVGLDDSYNTDQRIYETDNYNSNLQSLLKLFPNIKCLDFRCMPNIKINDIQSLYNCTRNLEIINLHNMANLNIRILLSLYRMPKLTKILINDPIFFCQYSEDQLFINKDEWKILISESITTICINSLNMNMDIVDYIIKSTINLETIIICQNIYNLCIKNMIVGSGVRENKSNEYLIFYSWEDVKCNNRSISGIKVPWRPTFKNMFKY